MKRKEAEDVIGGKDAWENVDRADGEFLGIFFRVCLRWLRRTGGEVGKMSEVMGWIGVGGAVGEASERDLFPGGGMRYLFVARSESIISCESRFSSGAPNLNISPIPLPPPPPETLSIPPPPPLAYNTLLTSLPPHSTMPERNLQRCLSFLLPSADTERGRADDYILQGAYS